MLKNAWNDRILRRVVLGSFVLAFVLSQGVPLFDDDFTSWFWKIKDKSFWAILWEWISPISTQPQYWGFNERPVQALVYRIGYWISGYESWSYFLYKDLVYAGIGGMMYLWGLRLTGTTTNGKLAAAVGAALLVLAPPPAAAHVLHSDLATTAELAFLVLSYLMWEEVEATPLQWQGLPSLKQPAQRRWLLRWCGLSVATYLAYKSKADLKVLPGILGAYLVLQPERRKQWAYFAVPLGLMALLAVPWGPGIFAKAPPFMPGSQGSEIGWMWQPASFDRLKDFLISAYSLNLRAWLVEPTLSLSANVGLVLVGLLVFFGFTIEGLDKVAWLRLKTPVDRARLFCLIWFGAMLVAVSPLPALNYTFRIRYGILPLIPATLLLSWGLGLFFEGSRAKGRPRWVFALGLAVLSAQAAISLARSTKFRHDLGQVMIAVDRVYEHVDKHFPNAKLALLPDFRPYDYRPTMGTAIRERSWLKSNEELRSFKPLETYVISWNASLWEELELIEAFPGCRSTTILDHLLPCEEGRGTFLMRYIGKDPLYAKGEALRAKKDLVGAMKEHEAFLARYPKNLGGHFVYGLEALQTGQWAKAESSYSLIERMMPDHASVMYNHALALKELKHLDAAIVRFKRLRGQDPGNYGVLYNLFATYKAANRPSAAREVLEDLQRRFPNNGELKQLSP